MPETAKESMGRMEEINPSSPPTAPLLPVSFTPRPHQGLQIHM